MEPKAFISHTFDDKELYARPLARKLRELGINAWLDEWEIKPGDKLVQKIFETGIEQMDAFIVVLSKSSVEKPWVKAELDVAVVRNIEKLMRLIPVKVDDCVVPTALVGHVYLSTDKDGGIEEIAKKIADTLHGVSSAPAMGVPPSYVTNASIALPGLSVRESKVLERLYDVNLDNEGILLGVGSAISVLEEEGISQPETLECLEVLVGQRYLSDPHKTRGYINMISFSTRTILAIAGAKGVDVPRLRCVFASTLLNSPNQSVLLDQYLIDQEIKRLHLWAIVKEFEAQGWIWWPRGLGRSLGGVRVKSEALLKRWTDSNCQ